MSIIERGLFIVALSCRSYDAMNLLRVSVPYIFRKSDTVQLCYLEKREEGDTVEYFMNGMLHNIGAGLIYSQFQTVYAPLIQAKVTPCTGHKVSDSWKLRDIGKKLQCWHLSIPAYPIVGRLQASMADRFLAPSSRGLPTVQQERTTQYQSVQRRIP